MITHKEVKKFLSNFDYWLNEQTAEMVQKYLGNYIAQQEAQSKRFAKVEELSELDALVELYEQFHRSKKAKEEILELKEFDFTIDDTKKRFFALMNDVGNIEDENSSLIYHMRMGDIKMIESSLDYIAIERELLDLERKYHKADVQREKYKIYKEIYLDARYEYHKKYMYYLKKAMKLRKQIYEMEVKLYGRE